MIKIVFLGTNGWYDTNTGSTLCILLETQDAYIVLDAGNGIYKLDRYVKKEKPVYLFLSHVHLDHIFGLHILDKFKFKKGLYIYGPPGSKRALNKIMNKSFTVPFPKLPFKVELFEIREGRHKKPVNFSCKRLVHPVHCFGYRFELEDKVISFCTDTGLCKNAITLAREADLLITECSYNPGECVGHWPHLNPKAAAILATKAQAEKLALVHFDAARYLTIEQRKRAERLAKQNFKKVFSAVDDLELRI